MDAQDIKSALRQRGLKQVQLARFIGIEENKLSKTLSGERRFTVPEMDKVRQFFAENEPAMEGYRLPAIPVLGRVPAGRWREAVRNPKGAMPAPDPSIPPRAFALTVDGDSMDEYIGDGGTIIVDPDDLDLFPGNTYVVLDDTGQTTFKRFEDAPARLVPCSSNPAHTEIRLGSGGSYEVVGRVIWRASRM